MDTNQQIFFIYVWTAIVIAFAFINCCSACFTVQKEQTYKKDVIERLERIETIVKKNSVINVRPYM